MPSMGRKYAAAKTVKLPAMPTTKSSGSVTSGKITASSYGQYKTQGTITLARRKTT